MAIAQLLAAMKAAGGGGGGSFPIFEGVTHTPLGSANTVHAIDMPATVTAGDLLVVVIVAAGASSGNVAVAGFTAWTNSYDTGGSGNRTWVFRKVATGSEGGTTVNATFAMTAIGNAVAMRVSGASTTGTFTAQASKFIDAATEASSNLAAPWGVANTLWLSVASGYYDDDATAYPFASSQGRYGLSGALNIYISTKQQAIGTVVPGAISFAVLNYGSLITLGIKPV